MTKRELALQFIRDIFRARTPIELAEQELLEAQLAKMDAESSLEYYIAMVQYNQKRIDRLIEHLEGMYARKEFNSQPDIRVDWDKRVDAFVARAIDSSTTASESKEEIKRRGV